MTDSNGIKIIVAMHKEYPIAQDSIYLPLHVGKAISKVRLNIQGDDEGTNISEKNANYCELTGVYWAWKNLDEDYIGLSHYRRYFCVARKKDKFKSVLTEEQAQRLLKTTDVILPKKRNYYIETNESQYLHAHHAEGWQEMLHIIQQDYPEYVPALEHMRNSTKGHRFNMFIMKKEYFDAYCEWLFDILFKVEQRIDISGYSPAEERVFGYLSERLLDVWIDTNRIAYTEVPVLYMEKQNWLQKGTAFLKRKFVDGHFRWNC
jgi:hypothetical protein